MSLSEEIENKGMRCFRLKIKERSISPCTISYHFKARNEVFWNGRKLENKNSYCYRIEGIEMKVRDRMEILAFEKKTGEVIKIVSLELMEIHKKSLLLLELAISERDEIHEKKEIEECPTCHRSFYLDFGSVN